MSNQSKMDQAIGHGATMEAAGKGGWPCGMMLVVLVLGLAAFVGLPVMLGM